MICRLFFWFAPLYLIGQTADVPLGVRLTPPANVPATVMDRFRAEFPKASPSWQQYGEADWAATFSDDSTQFPRTIVYDKSGTMVEGKKQVEKGTYPQTIDQYFHTHYPTDNYAVWRLDRREQPKNWYVVRGDDTTWFREDGTYAYQLNVRKPETLAGDQDADIMQTLWGLNRMRLDILAVAEKNGFITNTRQKQAQELDRDLKTIAAKLQVSLAYEPDEKEKARLHSLSELQGDQLSRTVNRELQKTSAQINRHLSRAARSGNDQMKSLAEKFGGPD